MDKIDLIVAVLGIISAVIGLLTAIMQLQHVSHPRGPQEARSVDIRKWLKRVFILFGIPFIVLLAYREWDSVKQIGRDVVGFAKKGISRTITIRKVEDLPIKIDTSEFRRGYYRLKIYPEEGKESYWGDCDNGKSLRGYAVDNESTRKRVINPREGNIVVFSGKDRSRHDDLIYIREDTPLAVFLDLDGITVGTNCVINLSARLFFIPEQV